VRLPGFLVVLVVFQGLLGMWTVTLLLKPAIVSAHLVGGLTTMALLWWLALRVDRTTRSAAESGLRSLALFGLAVLAMQILLGGWVSTNYGGAGVPGFPDLPAFILAGHGFQGRLRALARPRHRLRGGVLDHPARVAIHFVHRIGALVTAAVLGFLAWRAIRTGRSSAVRTAGVALAVLLVAQWTVGPLMVLKALPLELATTHNAIAALLVLTMVALLRFLWTPRTLR